MTHGTPSNAWDPGQDPTDREREIVALLDSALASATVRAQRNCAEHQPCPLGHQAVARAATTNQNRVR